MVSIFKCMICEEGYVGDEKPTHCPFCGAHIGYMVFAKDYVKKDTSGIGENSRNNIEAAIEIEISNAEFYFCASKKAGNVADETMFKRLGKIESEHASTLAKIINVKLPEISREKDICHKKNKDNLRESHEREQKATERYGKFLSEASEPRVIEVFEALIEIEKDHMTLTEGRF